MNDALTIISFVVGVLSLVYAVITNREKAKLEKIIKLRLLNISETVQEVVSNAELAHKNIDGTRRFLNGLEHSKGLKTALDLVAWAEADITAAHRISRRLKSDVDSLQEGLGFTGKIQPNKEYEKTNLINTSNDEKSDDS